MSTIASSYPLLDAFWTMLWIFAFILWIWLVIAVFVDIFRSPDMGGLAKAAWVIAIIFLPLLGVLIYLIARGSKMREHAYAEAAAQEQATREYIQQVSSTTTTSTSDELAKLAGLRDSGVISPAEFDQAKAKLLQSA